MRYVAFTVCMAVLLFGQAARAAESSPDEIHMLEAVTVTATKREQKVKDIAASVSTVSGMDLENAGAATLQEASRLFPNVYMKSTSSGNEIVIRGFSTWDTALQSPAGLYVDGVPYPLSFMQNMYLQDIERIEVLRGPQGTLYGRNSESGVVNVVRRKPDDTTRASVFSEVGTYDTFRLGASVSTPIVEDTVYFSTSVLRYQTDGYVKNTYKDDDQAARHSADAGLAMLRFTPTKELDVRFSLDASHQEDGRGTMRFATGPNRSGRLKVRSNAADEASSDFVVPALVAEYTGKTVKVASITSYMDYAYKMKSDIDRTPSPIGISDMKIDQSNVTQELRFSSMGEEKLSWVTGLFFGAASTRTDMDRLRRVAATTTWLHTYYTEDTGAVFGQATYSLFDNFRLSAGARGEYTKLSGDQSFTGGSGVRRKYDKDADFTELLPMASLSWDMTANVTGYATWSQGYLPGGFNVFSASNKDNFYYEPEYSTNYELGLKTGWLDNRLLVNAAVFHSKIRDKQVREEDPSGGVGTWKFTNSAKAGSKGVELEVKAYPLAGLELRGGIGYARSKIEEWSVPTVGGGTKSYDGNRLPWAPDLTYTIGLGYTHASGLFAQADFYGSGKQYFDAENSLRDSGYKTVNLQFGYRGENWEFSLWAKNIFDDKYATKKLVSNGQTIVEDGDPMTFGSSVIWRF